ncbi:MAG: ATP synthase F1 subunit gamma [Nitrospirae bacterium GWF2_44_13]|nr:MAG: ATP synthase F1 subunit gamma [Nitrospirae bacterium GWF2_44_13]OGW35320.1 MAG: ATP synthase F1 subunit gamma [Nitrospirae bacterium GWD2_44_7]OGW63783.1 MAG: ATP synthase F1 subunit gamma [Nitrospirae bacterium RIFOXYA2_FULL_44_9]HBG92008.1 ATP synthase F1 subunit gamma [Nitrospiraceae bacterium]HBU05560.1 ATP synthase F1 subunit gamma [Nitrospiraceae bacterium]
MPTLRDIKRRIKAVHSTSKITKAMKMVAASKFRKAQQRMFELRPYADRMNSVLSSLAGGAESEIHPLLAVRPRQKVDIIVLTSDRGLCGAFNSNILRAASKHISHLQKEGFEVNVSAIGRKAADYFKRRNVPLKKSWTGISGRISYANAQEIATDIIERYTNEATDEIILAYNEFKSVAAQKVVVTRLLPLASIEAAAETLPVFNFIYEPSKEDIFNNLLPKNVEIQVFRALLESQASEEAARMSAMENATKAANDMINSLTLQFNKARQASITRELMDIVGGVEALKG